MILKSDLPSELHKFAYSDAGGKQTTALVAWGVVHQLDQDKGQVQVSLVPEHQSFVIGVGPMWPRRWFNPDVLKADGPSFRKDSFGEPAPGQFNHSEWLQHYPLFVTVKAPQTLASGAVLLVPGHVYSAREVHNAKWNWHGYEVFCPLTRKPVFVTTDNCTPEKP